MHQQLELFDDIDASIYAISVDTPENLKELSDAIKEAYPRDDEKEITFISDPELELIDFMNMKNGEIAYRGYGILNNDGQVVFSNVNDNWGEQMEDTLEKIQKNYEKINK